MAILVNMGQRGFILKEGFLAPGKEIIVDNETGKQLASVYKTELKLICSERELKQEVKQEAEKEALKEEKHETPKVESKSEIKPVKRYRRKAQAK